MNTISVPSEKPSRFTAPVIAGVALGAALIGGNIYFASKTNQLEDEVSGLKSSMKTELAALQTESKTLNAQKERALAELQQQIEATSQKSNQVAMQAGAQARRYSDQVAKKMTEAQMQQLQQSSQQLQEQFSSQMGEMKQSHSKTSDQVTGIASDVGNVKTEVASTKSELEKTIADLRSVRGDMGVQSGLIATNAKELAALRALGERSYVEFQLPKTKAPQKVGDVALQLKKWDAKRNRFTIELIADDKRVEKKDRSVNEPVQFYTAKARIPYEIVVNEVQRDKIVGYLAAPKVKEARN